MKYRSKPEFVEAVQYDGENVSEIGKKFQVPYTHTEFAPILNLKRSKVLMPGDFVFKNEWGVVDVLPEKQFLSIYEKCAQ